MWFNTNALHCCSRVNLDPDTLRFLSDSSPLLGTWIRLALLWVKLSLRRSWIVTERYPAVRSRGQCPMRVQVWTHTHTHTHSTKGWFGWSGGDSMLCFCSWLWQCYRDSGDGHLSDQAVKGFCWRPLQSTHQLAAGLLARDWVQILWLCSEVKIYMVFLCFL